MKNSMPNTFRVEFYKNFLDNMLHVALSDWFDLIPKCTLNDLKNTVGRDFGHKSQS